MRAWGAVGNFRADAKLSTWLVRIVINEALGRLRRRGAQILPLDATMDLAAAQTEDLVEDDPDQRPDRAAMRSEVRRLIEASIDSLPDSFRTVFILRAAEERSVEEISVALALPESTARTRYFRACGPPREGRARNIDLSLGDAFSFDGQRCDRIVAGVLVQLEQDRGTIRS